MAGAGEGTGMQSARSIIIIKAEISIMTKLDKLNQRYFCEWL